MILNIKQCKVFEKQEYKMELKEFIKLSIRDIALAINEVNADSHGTYEVKPQNITEAANALYAKTTVVSAGKVVTLLKFDLSVESSNGGGGSIGVRLNVIEGSIGKSKRILEGNRISFTLPVVLPQQKSECSEHSKHPHSADNQKISEQSESH
jgi:hypothetical protein